MDFREQRKMKEQRVENRRGWKQGIKRKGSKGKRERTGKETKGIERRGEERSFLIGSS